ncbi:uncharacterized protein [Zea mays]|nr:uncharacterized protein LOC111591368 [Zea mays]|eukprot:XP_023158162.1 uncharacterized protein LOC111591368 [Zea mays]
MAAQTIPPTHPAQKANSNMGCRNNLYISRPLESQPVWHGMYRCIDGTKLATVCLPPPATGSALSSTQVRTERLQPFGHQPAPSISLSLARAWPRNKGGAWRPPQHSPIKKAPPGPGPASRVRPNGGTTKKGRHEKGSSSQQGAPPVFSSISVLGESRRRRLRRRRQRGQKWLRLAGGRESRQLHGRLVGRLMSTTWFGVPCC